MAKVSRSIELSNVELISLISKEYGVEVEGSTLCLVYVNGKFEGVKLSYGEENR